MLTPDQIEQLNAWVHAGYMTASEIADAIVESDESDADKAALAKGVQAVAVDAITARRREVASLGGDYARLHDVFATLEKEGVLARENYWCCATCAYAAIDEEVLEASGRGEPVRGDVLFHNQDTGRAVESGRLLLRYGGATDNPQKEGAAASKKIGEDIVALLRSASFTPEWSGSPDDVITLPIVWDKPPPLEGE